MTLEDSYQQRSRLPELDLLRALAVFLVLGRHIIYIPTTLDQFPRLILTYWREVGWIGVDLFFVLSGFLVSGLLFREQLQTGQVRIIRFLIRRGLKIYPSFYVMLIASTASCYFLNLPFPLDSKRFFGELLFLQNYIGSIWPHTWSLAIEEHFYLLLAFVVWRMKVDGQGLQNPFANLPRLVLVISILLLGLRTLIAYRLPAGSFAATLPLTHLRIDSLLFGVLLAYFYHFFREQTQTLVFRFSKIIFLANVIAFTLPVLYPLTESRVMYSLGFTFLYLGFGGLLLLILFSQSNYKSMLLKKFQFISIFGSQSYSIYLWHFMCYRMLVLVWDPKSGVHSDFYLHTICYLIASVVLGSLFAKAIEFPVLRLRDKYFA